MGLRHPLVILEQRSRVLWNSTHRVPLVIKRLDSLSLLHILDFLPPDVVWLSGLKVNVGVGLPSEELGPEVFEKIFV